MTGQETLAQTIRDCLNLFWTHEWNPSWIPGNPANDLNWTIDAVGTMTDEEVEIALFRNVNTGETVEDCYSKEVLKAAQKALLLAEKKNFQSEETQEKAGQFTEMVLSNFNLTELIG